MFIRDLIDKRRANTAETSSPPRQTIKLGDYRAPVINVRYLQLIRTVFNLEANAQRRRHTVAMVSVGSGDGTSSVIAGLGVELTCYTGSSAVIASTRDLCYLSKANPEEMLQSCHESRVPGLWRFRQPGRQTSPLPLAEVSTLQQTPPFFPEFLSACIRRLNQSFVYALLDCQPLSISSDALIVAPMVDGVVLVVEAGRTTREQVKRARKMIEMSGGRLLGFVLNKRRNSIPDSIDKRL